MAGPYLLALSSPLRLMDDSVSYLARADGLPLPPGARRFPPGYSTLLDGLEHVGLGTPAGFVALNLVMLAIGLAAAYLLCRRVLRLEAVSSAGICLAVLLSHSASLFSASPMSDVPFFAVAMTCLVVLWLAGGKAGFGRYTLLGLAVALAAAGTSIRLQGIALAPPILFVAFAGPARPPLSSRRSTGAVVGVAAFLVLAGAAVLFVRASSYPNVLGDWWRLGGGPLAVIDRWGTQVGTKLVSIGELATQTTCCGRISPALMPELALAGAAALVPVALGLLGRRRLEFIEVFVLSTAAVIVVYQGAEARFWLPALPFLLAYGALGAARMARWRPFRFALILYAAAFVAAGGVWLGDSIRLSTAGDDFPRAWAGRVGAPIAASYRGS